MAKLPAVVPLLAALAAGTHSVASAGATVPAASRRSRFLLTNGVAYNSPPPLPSPYYDCSKKSADVCLAAGSPGPTCCRGRCVDTAAGDSDHCGGCNKACKHGRVCCGGRCVDLSKDRDNCGQCFNRCASKCSYGFCDYAQ